MAQVVCTGSCVISTVALAYLIAVFNPKANPTHLDCKRPLTNVSLKSLVVAGLLALLSGAYLIAVGRIG